MTTKHQRSSAVGASSRAADLGVGVALMMMFSRGPATLALATFFVTICYYLLLLPTLISSTPWDLNIAIVGAGPSGIFACIHHRLANSQLPLKMK